MTTFADGYRLATEQECRDWQNLSGAPHVTFGCTGCGMVAWSAKNLTLTDEGKYNGCRNIFFLGEYGTECKCSADLLRCITKD